MKLYFYFLETGKIRCAECEVEEKPKTYKPVIGYSNDVVVLTENNIQKVADVFRSKMRYKIARAKQDITFANDSINQCNEALSMIDEWEKQTK